MGQIGVFHSPLAARNSSKFSDLANFQVPVKLGFSSPILLSLSVLPDVGDRDLREVGQVRLLLVGALSTRPVMAYSQGSEGWCY